jgi:hypothetical protein
MATELGQETQGFLARKGSALVRNSVSPIMETELVPGSVLEVSTWHLVAPSSQSSKTSFAWKDSIIICVNTTAQTALSMSSLLSSCAKSMEMLTLHPTSGTK